MIPYRFTIQWHITEQCNCRCKHCYQTDYSDKGKYFEDLRGYYNKIEDFVLSFKRNNKFFKSHINFTGGEPFLKEEFLDLLDLVYSRRVFSFGILSNGYLVSEFNLQKLKSLNPKFVQLSLEGNKAINDSIRGLGSYNQTVKSINVYKKLGIPVLISFTANTGNYKFFPEVVRVSRKFKVDKVWTDRYLPNCKTDPLVMNDVEVKDYFEIIRNASKCKFPFIFNKTNVSFNRALQFLTNGGQPYNCSAGKTLLTIMPNGDVFPCRRMPIKLANLNSCDLKELYNNNKILLDLQSSENLDTACQLCYYKNSCNGGLKCLSFAMYGDYNKRDPNCWIK